MLQTQHLEILTGGLRTPQMGLLSVPVTKPCFSFVSMEALLIKFSSLQLLSRVWLFATPWIIAHQVSLSISNSQSSLKIYYLLIKTLCKYVHHIGPVWGIHLHRHFLKRHSLCLHWPTLRTRRVRQATNSEQVQTYLHQVVKTVKCSTVSPKSLTRFLGPRGHWL